jgi:hypothetical protein
MRRTSTLLTMILASFLAACHHPYNTNTGSGGTSGTTGGTGTSGGTSGTAGGTGTSGSNGTGSGTSGSDNGTSSDPHEIAERMKKRPPANSGAQPKTTDPDKVMVH